jgi:pimeloyl-ACP methyl ester carboxylesterase
MINVFRDQMPRPLVGIGHSMGGNHLSTLALMHPRLLSKLVLIDPVINRSDVRQKPDIVRASTFRQDFWPSREVAQKSFLKSKFYQTWDKRVFARWMEFGLRDLPTAVYPESSGKTGVTLSTTKHQEVQSFMRPNFQGKTETGEDVLDRDAQPDMDVRVGIRYPFYRAEP